jgi:hypothetical protein
MIDEEKLLARLNLIDTNMAELAMMVGKLITTTNENTEAIDITSRALAAFIEEVKGLDEEAMCSDDDIY